MQSLFPQRLPQGNGGNRRTNVVVSFPAGKCQNLPAPAPNTGKSLITPEPRRGTLSLERDNDGLTHLVWTDRSTGVREDDRIIFPDDIRFKRAKTGRPDDRVYFLHYVASTQYFFYWMQEKSSEKDEERCAKINEYANSPAAADAALAAINQANAQAAAAAGAGADGAQNAWLQNLGLGLPGLDPSATTRPAGTQPQQQPAVDPAFNLDISSLLNQFNANINNTFNTPAASASAPITLDSSFLELPSVAERLTPHMPTGQQSASDLRTLVGTPNFQTSFAAVVAERGAIAGRLDLAAMASSTEARDRIVNDVVNTLRRLHPTATNPPSNSAGGGASSNDRMEE